MRPGHVWSPWSGIETKALLEAVQEYGIGQWAAILRDPVYGPNLQGRSNVDLKDKWRVLERARMRNGGQPVAQYARRAGLDDINSMSTEPMPMPYRVRKRPTSKQRPAKSSPKRFDDTSIVQAVVKQNPNLHPAGPVAIVATAIDDHAQTIQQLDQRNRDVEQHAEQLTMQQQMFEKDLMFMKKHMSMNARF